MGRAKYHVDKTVEEYRRLVEQCREAARRVLAANEQADLLARAHTWELLADRVGRVAR